MRNFGAYLVLLLEHLRYTSDSATQALYYRVCREQVSHTPQRARWVGQAISGEKREPNKSNKV